MLLWTPLEAPTITLFHAFFQAAINFKSVNEVSSHSVFLLCSLGKKNHAWQVSSVQKYLSDKHESPGLVLKTHKGSQASWHMLIIPEQKRWNRQISIAWCPDSLCYLHTWQFSGEEESLSKTTTTKTTKTTTSKQSTKVFSWKMIQLWD